MHRDANLGKRNALVIPGLLLSVYSLVGILYLLAIRAESEACGDGRYLELYYACRDGAWLLAMPLILGVALLAFGTFMFRSTSTCPLGHGTGATSVLALLISLCVLPLLAALVTYAIEDPEAPYAIVYGDTEYGQVRLLAGAGAAGLLMLVPYLALYIGQSRSHACCRKASCFEPCFCDEPAADAALPPGADATPASTTKFDAVWKRAPAPAAAPVAAPATVAVEPVVAPTALPHVPVSPSTDLGQWSPPENSPPTIYGAPAATKPATSGTKTRSVKKASAKKPAKKSS